MKTLSIYQVDAFAAKIFEGNPAAVIPLDSWLDESTMQTIAMENNLSETAFIVHEDQGFRIRWFTPKKEVDLCGHATLASAYVIFFHLGWTQDEVIFQSLSGPLGVRKGGENLWMDFPSRPGEPVDQETLEAVGQALGARPLEVLKSRDYLAIFKDESVVAGLQPDFDKVAQLEALAVIASAPGQSVDFVSRFFAPRAGINEDPVTGSAHTTLIPYWSDQLGKDQLQARQISFRGGSLSCVQRGDRVLIGGQVRLVLRGEFYLEYE